MNKIDILLGLQWGDEGKGKIVDLIAPKYDIIARFQGGPNAGHTLVFNDQKHVLHQIPSGIFQPNSKNIIGSGVVLDPIILKNEIEGLKKMGINAASSLYISRKAMLIIPTHQLLDKADEQKKGHNKIGSTLKGIRPAYQDKVARQGLRVGDINQPDFQQKLDNLANIHLKRLENYRLNPHWEELKAPFLEAIDFLRKLNCIDSEYFLNQELKAGAAILAEGAQGTLLDIDFGSYPFVTSSNTISAGACTGLGIAPTHVREVFGIFKAYSTRVGSGPFPTELSDDDGEKIRTSGNEFGSTTGRPRRCGWLDLPALKYAIMINGVSRLFMMKADVLNPFPSIKVCTQYTLADGTTIDRIPHDKEDQKNITPLYVEMKGWNTSLENITNKDMPSELSHYIAFLEEELKVPISLVSTGPDRLQTIFL